MSQVTLDIGGRHYTVSCGEGEEAHVLKLGRMIDEKVTSVTGGKPTPEAQALLFAALVLADELHDAGSGGSQRTGPDEGELASVLERFADSMENCAESLESRLPAS